MGKYAKSIPPISPKTTAIFNKYDWPGNIRELENVIKRIILLGEEEVIRGSIGQPVNGGITPFSAESFRENDSRSKEILNLKRVKSEAAKLAEKEVIQKTLQETRWNRKKAAEMLGVSYKALLYKMHKYRMGEI
jgi:DNA-binding NtrC family response regulator